MNATQATLIRHSQESQRPQILAGGIVTFALATFAVIFRFCSRRIQRCPVWLDDWLILGAWFCAVAYLVDLIFSVVHNGMGLHNDQLSQQQIEGGLKDLFIVDLAYTMALVLIKLSVLAFYWRIFKNTIIRTPIKIITVVVFCWLIARIPPICLRCIPLQKYWDPSIPGECNINIGKFFLGTVSVHLLIDISLLILPIPVIRTLQISRAQKWGIYGTFALGGFICCSSVVQLVVSGRLSEHFDDVNWYIAPVMMWAAVEVNMTIVSACLPSLRPVYLFAINGFSSSGLRESGTHGATGRGSHIRTGSYPNAHNTWNSKADNSDLSELITVTEEEMTPMPSRCKVKGNYHSDEMPFSAVGQNKILVTDEVKIERVTQ